MNTIRTASQQTVATSVKALVFGIVATAALTVGLAQAQSGKHGDREARPIKLDTVYITATRVVAQAQVHTLPTVYITGRRATTLDDTQVAAATDINASLPL